MGIVDEDVVAVRERADIVAVASQFMQLKRSGRRWLGLCPFHTEKTPSFFLNAERGFYICFGCQASGDTIQLVRELQHVEFVEAVEWLAQQSGVTLRYTDRAHGEHRQRKRVLVEALERAVEWYHQRLLTGEDGGPARAYLRSRGLDGEVVRSYRLGWAPDGWDELARHLSLSDKVLTDAGLGFVNRRQRQQDFFRGRVLFPIFEPRGEPIGFGARVLPGGEGPKYRNTPQTPLYDKSKVLYGLNWVKDDVVKADEVIVCEGYTDVIGFARAGVPRAVATCGTALTEHHVRQLTRFARRVVLAFDPDVAGAAAAERFYEWEQRHELEVAVADLPAGEDPGELARRDPDRLRAAVEQPVPFLGFRVERALVARNGSSPEDRVRTAEAALAVIREHPNDLVRDQYLMQVSDRCGVDIDRLRASLRSGRLPSTPRPSTSTSARSRGRDTPETVALRLAVDHEQGPVALSLLHEVLFVSDVHALAFRALLDVGGDVHGALDAAAPEAADLLRRLLAEDATGDDPADVRRVLLQLAGKRELQRLRADLRSGGDAEALNPLIRWLSTRLDEVRPDSRTDPAREDQLLAWLADRAEERS